MRGHLLDVECSPARSVRWVSASALDLMRSLCLRRQLQLRLQLAVQLAALTAMQMATVQMAVQIVQTVVAGLRVTCAESYLSCAVC